VPHLEEAIRKAIHLGSIIFPVATVFFYRVYGPEGRIFLASILAMLAVVLLMLDLLKARHKPFKSLIYGVFGKVLRKNELQGGMTASTIVVASAAFTILIFREPIAVAALVFLSLGDSAAALVGKHLGRIRLVGRRTLEGSLASLSACLLGSMAILWTGPDFGWGITPVVLLAGSVAATLSELFDLPLDDNFRIPVFAGLVMELVLPG